MRKSELKIKTDDIFAQLPENVSWDDLMQQIYVRQKIENGLKDAEQGQLYTSDDVRTRIRSKK
ncbi:MAG: hypothetical protein PQJ58_06505 [Spirochaetales bacterium]|nr:hypothetical protein [Spirochaetales bacterium]